MTSSDQASQSTEGKEKGFFGNLMDGKTPAISNIEKAYSRAGASNNHTPGSASKLGSQDQKGAGAHQGLGSDKFSKDFGDQRQEPSAVGKLFNNMINGTDNTK